MSSDNTSSAVTYTSISSDSNGPSWGIPLMNAGELLKMDPYEEVAQQGQAPPLSHAYVEDQPYVDDASPIAESPGYITDSESMEEDSIDYPDEPEDDDKDPKEDDNKDPEEDPSEEHEHEDDDEAPSEENEPEDEDNREDEPFEGSDETEPFEEDETAVTPPPPP
ncbi:hypothetical protein Tco_0165122, partial [Tanacetum coccineum]